MFNFKVSVLDHISLSMSPLHWDGAPAHSHNLGHQEETKNWGLLISDRAVYLNKSLLGSNICLEPHLSLLRSLLPIRAGSHLPENLRGFLTPWKNWGRRTWFSPLVLLLWGIFYKKVFESRPSRSEIHFYVLDPPFSSPTQNERQGSAVGHKDVLD